MPKFYLGTVTIPDLVKYYLMERFKGIYFPHEESSVYDDAYDIYYSAKNKSKMVQQAFDGFIAGFERGMKFQLEHK